MSTRKTGILRNVVLPLNSVGLILLLIWALQSGRFPGLDRGPKVYDVSSAQSSFFSLGGQPLGAEQGDGPGIGDPAPAFTLLDTDGKPAQLSDFRGKVVLVNFWATWCPPCRKEFPELAKAYDEHNGDFVILGVDLQENTGEVRKFVEEFGAKFPIVIDVDASVSKAYRLVGLPSSFFIDQQGILRDQFFGPLSRKTLDEKIEQTRQAGLAGG